MNIKTGSAAFVLMLLDGGGDFLAVEVDADFLATSTTSLSINLSFFQKSY